MAEGMATQRIHGQKNGIENHDDRADADTEMLLAREVGEPHTLPSIMRQQDDENEGEVKEVAVDVLDNERERFFTEKFFTRFTDRAIDRIGPEGFVVSAAIIITSEAKAAGNPQNQKGR